MLYLHFDKTEQETFCDPESEELRYQQNAKCQLIPHSNRILLQPRVLCQAAVVSQGPPDILALHAVSIASYPHLVAVCQKAVTGIR